MHPANPFHRRLRLALLALPALQSCTAPLRAIPNPATTPDARTLLAESAAAHGLAALSRLRDLSVSYADKWPPLVPRLKPPTSWHIRWALTV